MMNLALANGERKALKPRKRKSQKGMIPMSSRLSFSDIPRGFVSLPAKVKRSRSTGTPWSSGKMEPPTRFEV